jgi:hypothetical protein
MGYILTNTAATTAAVTNRFVTSVAMKVGSYTVANASPVWSGGCLVTVTHTLVDTVDTLGTITITGTNLSGQAQSESITPLQGTVATSTKIYRTVTAVTGVAWVQGGAGADTIVVGCAAGNIACATGGTLGGVLVNNTVATLVTISHAGGTIMVIPASQAAGTYYNLGGVNFSGWLKVATTSTNDVTVFHTPTLPDYATS